MRQIVWIWISSPLLNRHKSLGKNFKLCVSIFFSIMSRIIPSTNIAVKTKREKKYIKMLWPQICICPVHLTQLFSITEKALYSSGLTPFIMLILLLWDSHYTRIKWRARSGAKILTSLTPKLLFLTTPYRWAESKN